MENVRLLREVMECMFTATKLKECSEKCCIQQPLIMLCLGYIGMDLVISEL